jgi:hypothetical protein
MTISCYFNLLNAFFVLINLFLTFCGILGFSDWLLSESLRRPLHAQRRRQNCSGCRRRLQGNFVERR